MKGLCFTLFLSISIPQIIMTHGVLSTDPSTSESHVMIDIARDRSPTTPAATMNVNSAAQVEKERVIEGLEGAMDLFRKGECSRFQVSGLIFNELEKWTELWNSKRGRHLTHTSQKSIPSLLSRMKVSHSQGRIQPLWK